MHPGVKDDSLERFQNSSIKTFGKTVLLGGVGIRELFSNGVLAAVGLKLGLVNSVPLSE